MRSTFETTSVSDMTLDQLRSEIMTWQQQKKVDIHLHWSEYFQGRWMARESSNLEHPAEITVDRNFDKSKVLIRASKQIFEDGQEGMDIILEHSDFYEKVLCNQQEQPGHCFRPYRLVWYGLE